MELSFTINEFKELLSLRVGLESCCKDVKAKSDAIYNKIEAPECWCETESPSGFCCLSSVAEGVTIAQNEIGILSMVAPSTPSEVQSYHCEVIEKVEAVV